MHVSEVTGLLYIVSVILFSDEFTNNLARLSHKGSLDKELGCVVNVPTKVKEALHVHVVTSALTAWFLHCTHHFLSSATEELAEKELSEPNAEIKDLVKGRAASDNAVGE